MAIHVRLLTAHAPGAIAVLEIRGPETDLRQLVAAHVNRPVAWQPGTVAHRWWRNASGAPLDDGLVVVRASDCVELHLHGGTGVLAAVHASLLVAGAISADGADETEDAHDRGWRASVERALAAARTARPARMLLQQAEAIPDWIARARRASTATAAEAVLDELRAGDRLAGFIEDPLPRVVLAGRPNAGKSTLFNALLGGDRALVSPHAGTTRDTVEAVIAVQGLPVELVDTAGLMEDALADDRLERRGQVRSLRALRDASLVLHLVDLTAGEPTLPTTPETLRDRDVAVMRVGTKADQLPLPPSPGPGLDPRRELAVSARDGAHLDVLLEGIAHRLQLPDDESIVPVPLGRLRQRLLRETASAPDPLRALAVLLPEAEW